MGSRTIKIDMGHKLPHWGRGFDRLDGPIPDGAVKEWTEACEVFFGATQQYAHVLSGDMVSSGRLSMSRGLSEIEGLIEYNGGRRSNAKPWWKHQEIDYTQYEVARGGSHDFFRRALVKTRDHMTEAAGKALGEAIDEVLG